MFGKRRQRQETGIALGRRGRRLLSERAQVEEELIPGFVRPVLYVVGLIVVGFVFWASLTSLSEVTMAPGEIVPSDKIKVVQHLDGGVIAEIAVEERALVRKGDVLLRVDGAEVRADKHQLQDRLAALELRAERLQAFAEEREPDFSVLALEYPELAADQQDNFETQEATLESTIEVLDRRVEQRKRRLKQLRSSLDAAQQHLVLTKETLSMRESLARRQLIERSTLLETRRARVTAQGEVNRISNEISLVQEELAEAEGQRVDAVNQLYRGARNELGTVRSEIAEVEERLQRIQARIDRLLVRAPDDGFVHDLQVQTVGQVIQPGALLMRIVPDSTPLEAEVRIAPEDIGYVTPGQRVNLRVSSYDYSRFGFAKGVVKRISASNVVAEDGTAYFRGWISLKEDHLGNDPEKYPVKPGMAVEAEIITGEKTLLAYLSKPVVDAMSRSFTER